jgi:hypothetical protein
VKERKKTGMIYEGKRKRKEVEGSESIIVLMY